MISIPDQYAAEVDLDTSFTLALEGSEILDENDWPTAYISTQSQKPPRIVSMPIELSLLTGRAAAAAGQSGLMALYDNLFGLMDLQAAQVLVTSNDFHEPTFRENLAATAEDLLSMSVVPVFNENDAISARDKARLNSFQECLLLWLLGNLHEAERIYVIAGWGKGELQGQ